MTGIIEGLMWLWKGETRCSRVVGVSLVLLLALGVRWVAFPYAYPAPGDAVHFVQAGVELAAGDKGAWSTGLSPGPQLVAAAAARAGLSPARGLQALSLLSGVVSVMVFVLLAWRLFGRWVHALLAGAVIGCNPNFVYYSVGGWSEMPYIAVLAVASLLAWRWLCGQQRGSIWIAILALLGVGSYFRPLESQSLALLCAAFGCVVALGRRNAKALVAVVAGVVVLACVEAPIYWMTYKMTGRMSLGTKDVNLVMGTSNYDSKAMHAISEPWAKEYAELKQVGVPRYMWERRAYYIRLWTANMARAFRLVGDAVFSGSFRLGPVWWFLVLLAGGILAWAGGAWRSWSFCLFLLLLPLAEISLANVQERYIVQSLPFAIMLFVDILIRAIDAAPLRTVRAVAILFLVFFLAKNSAQAVRLVDETDWYYFNARQVGQLLQQFGSDEETLMTQQYCMTLHFHDRYPRRLVGLPFGTIEDTAEYARQKGVSVIALSSWVFRHWPINALFHGAPPPADWRLVDEVVFARPSRFGDLEERYLVYRREPKPSAGDTTAGDSGP